MENTFDAKNKTCVPTNLIFDYENVLTTFNMKVSEDCHNNIVNALKENANELIKPLEKSLHLYDQSTEANTMSSILTNIIKYNMLDDKSVVNFEKKVFSLKYFFGNTPVPFGINLSKIVNEFMKNGKYMSIIIENERFHSLEFARLMCAYFSDQPSEQNPFEGMISRSFNALKEQYSKNIKYINIAWIRYLNFSASLTTDIPYALLDYVDDGNYKILFNLLKNHYDKPHNNAYGNLQEFAQKICKKIIKEINSQDIPSMLFIGQIYEECENYNSARAYYSKAATECDCFNGAISLINSYENEIRNLLDRKFQYGEDVGDKIAAFNKRIDELYNEWQNKLQNKCNDVANEQDKKDAEVQYVTLMTKYARHEKDRKDYESAYDILVKIPENLSESYRIYFEMGLLFQTSGTKYKSNKYYNPQKAVGMFKKAYRIVMDETVGEENKKVIKSILIPLANTLYTMKNYIEALNVCHKVLEIDKREKNAYKLIDKINNEAA